MQLYDNVKKYLSGAYDSVKKATLPLTGLVALVGLGIPSAKGNDLDAKSYLDQQESRQVDLNAYRVLSQTENDDQDQSFKFCTFGCFGCQGCHGCYGKITDQD